jgi:hypothetical protein
MLQNFGFTNKYVEMDPNDVFVSSVLLNGLDELYGLQYRLNVMVEL